MQFFSLTSVLAFAFVVGQASAANVVATATEFTVGDSIACSTSISNVASALASGDYCAVSSDNLECGHYVFYINQATPSVGYTCIAVDVAPDGDFYLSPSQFEDSSLGASSFTATYVVSPSD
ncbi:uncharacterized protein STEHIDRAFT_156222 [Stereum hirsutum FP-91666 SS1]|uniref:uncharacterized protein n=1 Tax=Stereum hirsutum (strain FP-91666) TaxID=721885 RepID=UPI000440F96D|nr:uncharacterized protein STEHIDRAFT_156222 [Stereum hirsutum FP-91666 SS1]EIM87233.1 hypothetical protein STEHIDRAFT_156222 [Stereum hirsutum FP-91666 SS1]